MRRVVAGVGAVLVAIVAVGCTEDEPVETPPPLTETGVVETAEPEPDPRPEPSPAPTRPPEMATFDEDGAKAAATYFLQLYPYVMNTHDLTEWNELSDEVCDFCTTVAQLGTEEAQAGRALIGLDIQIAGRKVEDLESDPPAFQVDFVATESTAQTIDVTSGSVIRTTPRTSPTGGVIILKVDPEVGWRVAYVAIGEAAE